MAMIGLRSNEKRAPWLRDEIHFNTGPPSRNNCDEWRQLPGRERLKSNTRTKKWLSSIARLAFCSDWSIELKKQKTPTRERDKERGNNERETKVLQSQSLPIAPRTNYTSAKHAPSGLFAITNKKQLIFHRRNLRIDDSFRRWNTRAQETHFDSFNARNAKMSNI